MSNDESRFHDIKQVKRDTVSGLAASSRNTHQRQTMLDVMRAHSDHPTADAIYIETRKVDGKISRGTVYRNLNHLAADGEIIHVKLPGADRYDCRLDFHYHLVCTCCGAVIDAPAAYDPAIDEAVQAQTGYRIYRHRTVFEGICPVCAAGEALNSNE
ncbi:MAG TPA: transcriptional repressor [Eubacteriales bacterium]|nr:transcriptional repressor [Clostridia bacterium]HRV73209.1 transcriptional repressor [Eubacteriales bacterium]